MHLRRILIIAVVLAILIGAAIYFYVISPQSSNPTSTPSPTPLPSQVFSPQTQFVPQGAKSRDVDQALADFGFQKSLPFFEKDNVVQSLNLTASTSALTTSAFLSYRIIGQNKAAVRAAFTDYFTNLGWEATKIFNTNQSPPMIFSTAHRTVVITLIDVLHVPGTDQLAIVAALTMQSVNSSNR